MNAWGLGGDAVSEVPVVERSEIVQSCQVQALQAATVGGPGGLPAEQ